MWLNCGCVLRLQVADSIPAQVSGSQSVSCVCVCVLRPNPPPPAPSFFPSQSYSLSLVTGKMSAWIRQPRPSPYSPFSSFHLPVYLFLPPFNTKSSSRLHLFFPRLYLQPAFDLRLCPNQPVKTAQPGVTSRSGRMWWDQILPGDIDSGRVCFIYPALQLRSSFKQAFSKKKPKSQSAHDEMEEMSDSLPSSPKLQHDNRQGSIATLRSSPSTTE